jgi:metallo-beta-lactamase class B
MTLRGAWIGLVFAISILGQPATIPESWTRPLTPHRIIGNIYYVGTYDLTSFLITTAQGHILINTGLADSTPLIRKNIEDLGFKFADIKILLTTQAHFDHVAAMAEVQRLTGAKMVATVRDTPALKDGGKSDFLMGPNSASWFTPVKVDGAIKDGQKITLGGAELTAHLHPGHTPGSVSYTTSIAEGGKTYRVLIANLPNINPGTVLVGNPKYPEIVQDFEHTIAAQKAMSCDVFLASHAQHYGLHDKYKPGDPYNPERFVDPAGYRAAVERYEKAFRQQLEKERAAK